MSRANSPPRAALRARALSCLMALAAPTAACECDGDDAPSEAERAAPEGAPGPGELTAPPGERAPGPIGRTLAVFDDATVTTHLLLLRRTGLAEGTRGDATAIGTGWIGGVERELFVAREEAVTGRSAHLFGPVGACEAPIARSLSLRGEGEGTEPTAYEALEVRPCEGTSVESIETTHPFGLEGEVEIVALLGDAMEPAPEAIATVVAQSEQEVGDGEEMDLAAREIPGTGATVAAGWQSYVVRDGVVIATFEDGVPAYATIAARAHLLARVGRELRLLTIGPDGLTPVEIDAPASEDDAPSRSSEDEASAANGEPGN